jgi:hypothetical protein
MYFTNAMLHIYPVITFAALNGAKVGGENQQIAFPGS